MKNKAVQDLYNGLMQLPVASPIFYFQDFPVRDDYYYRIFDYNIAVYTSFQLPYGTECRGVMFLMKGKTVIDIASRPMHKFFNYKENPESTFDCDISEVEIITKADGSLMSSYLNLDSEIKLKSKGSIKSDVANDANKHLIELNDELLMSDIRALESEGCTVNFEWTAPFNCIVLRYKEPKLTVLNVRNRYTGEYIPHKLLQQYPGIKKYLVNFDPAVDLAQFTKLSEFREFIRKMDYIEGYIVKHKTLWVKMKTDWYCNLHTSKFSISSDKQLFFAFVDGRLDDLRQIVDNDPYFTDRIEKAEKIFLSKIESLILEAKAVYEQFKNEPTSKDFYAKAATVKLSTTYLLDCCLRLYRNEDIMPNIKRQIRIHYKPFVEAINENPNRFCE